MIQIIDGTSYGLDDIRIFIKIHQRLVKRIEELEQFLKDLAEARKDQEERDTLKIAPIAGLLEKAELDGLKEIRAG